MKNKLPWIALVLAAFLVWNCGPTYPDDDSGNISYPVPEFSDAKLSYNSVRQELHCEIRVMYDLPVTDLTADLLLEGFQESSLQVALNDSGYLGDALPNDNIFSRNISLNRIDSIDGQIILQYAVREAGSLVQTYHDTLSVIANLPPLITEIAMPDTIVRPRTGSKALVIYVTVDDPNGVHDVISAFFQVKNNTSGEWGADYVMNDSGELGDAEAGDGIFSHGIQISSENSATTNYFRFRAKDTASNFSDWSLDSVVVR